MKTVFYSKKNKTCRNFFLPPLPKTEGRATKDQIFRVKTTIKRFIDKNSNSKAYAYSVEKIEILPGTLDNANSTIPKGNTSINADNLLFNVHKVNKRDGTEGPIALNDYSKVLDENGEPRKEQLSFMYNQTIKKTS